MMELSKKDLSELTGLTFRRLFDIDAGLPPEKKLFVKGESGKKYDLALFLQRWVDYNVDRATAGIDDLDSVKARHEKVKIEKTELEVKRLRGDLIKRKDVMKLWGDVVSAVQKNLLGIPNDIAPTLIMIRSSEMIAERIDTAIRDALSAISETPIPTYATESTEDDEGGAEESEG